MITIHRPDFSQRGEYARIQSLVDIDGNRNTIWFEVRREYGEYLCWERSDAFVIGLLNYAMRNGHDITCEAPMGEDLHYQITTYLIEAIAKVTPACTTPALRQRSTTVNCPVTMP